MPVTDRREPGVYVTIEDKSYIAPSFETGRVGYIVCVCDRGPHNRITKVTSTSKFHSLFGKPDYRRTSQAHYNADKFLQYSSNLLVTRVVPEDSYWGNVIISQNETPDAVAESYDFVNGSNIVTPNDASAYNAFDIGEWIYADGDTNAEAAQIIAKDDTPSFTFTLDRDYEGSSVSSSTAQKLEHFTVTSQTSVDNDNDLPDTSSDVVYYFYANGAGVFYNNIKIKGSRNIQMEKMYVDTNGNPLYKYVFMDIGIYQVNEDNTETLLEGPWTVSLIRRIPTGSTVRDLTSGRIIYIEDIINEESDFVRCKSAMAVENLITAVDSEDNRLQVMLLLSESVPIATNNIARGGLQLNEGTDGTGIYDTSGNLSMDSALEGLIKQAYMGVLTSIDGSVEQLPEVTYPWYIPDYILCGGYSSDIQDGARQLTEYRQDCIVLADTGQYVSDYETDIERRLNNIPWNTWTGIIYVQYRRIFDYYTGNRIWINPTYHAIERHLYCDGMYFLSEPVAGIEKGAIQENIDLAYRANHTERGDLIDNELNPVIVENQGKYILSQFTSWKSLSILKRAHVAKFVAFIRKVIPTLLKDILQRRATGYWINQGKFRVDNFLSNFLENPAVERYSVLKSFTTNVSFDEISSELNIVVDLTFIRAIEKINVYLIVH